MFMTPISNADIEAYNAKGGSNAASSDPQAAQDRFLKLFVAQLDNQDPLNPMDNAQMTSQMAQINTVTGIQQLNQTLQGMATQFSALQNMQGISLVGRQVVVDGNRLNVSGTTAQGAFSLPAGADVTRVDVLSSAGAVIGSASLGAKAAGMNNFDLDLAALGIDPAAAAGFQVFATSGGSAVTATTMARPRIESVGMVDGAMRLRTTQGQTISYDQILAFQ
jgi:flagellar basal-body rod modification protein FlgD